MALTERIHLWLTQRRRRAQLRHLAAEIRSRQALPARLLAWLPNTEATRPNSGDPCHPGRDRRRGDVLGRMAARLDRLLWRLPLLRRCRPGWRLFRAYHRTRHLLLCTLLRLLIPLLWRELLTQSLRRWIRLRSGL